MENLTLTLTLPADLADWLQEKAGENTNRYAVALLLAARDAAEYQAWKDSLTPQQRRQEEEALTKALDEAFEAVAAGRHHLLDPEEAHQKMREKAGIKGG